jgi:hypothetical protein
MSRSFMLRNLSVALGDFLAGLLAYDRAEKDTLMRSPSSQW